MLTKINSIVQNAYNSSKGKVPRYLYHLTSAENFKKMQSDAFCRTSGNDHFLKKKSIFMFDLMNFLKDWSRKKVDRCGGMSIQELLLDEVTCEVFDPSGIVVLKIPTSKLNIENLKIRSQDTFFKAMNAKDLSTLSSKELEHIEQGASSLYTSLYKQRKTPIEFVYQENIPIESISVIGKLTSDDVAQISRTSAGPDMKGVLMTLFKGTPEEKAIKNHYSK